LWLFASNIQMEHTSDLVNEGKRLHKTSHENHSGKNSELEIDRIRIFSINNAPPTRF
jgi:CRISPR-associated exonuclease Cas4